MEDSGDATGDGGAQTYHSDRKGRLEMKDVVLVSPQPGQHGGRPGERELLSFVKDERACPETVDVVFGRTAVGVLGTVEIDLVPQPLQGADLLCDAGHHPVDGGQVAVGEDGDLHTQSFVAQGALTSP